MSSIINKALKTTEACEGYILSATSMEVEFENNILKNINSRETNGTALRVVADGRIGFSTSTMDGDDEDLIDMARDVARFGRKQDFEFSECKQKKDIICYNKEVEDFTVDDMVDIGRDLIDFIMKTERDILAFSSVSKGVSDIRLINSKGVDKGYKKSWFSVAGGGKITEEGNFLVIYDYAVSAGVVPSSDIGHIKEKVKEDISIAKVNIPLSSGRYKVLISPNAAGDVVNPICAAANGKHVQKGVSPLRDKIGQKIFDSRISLIDDGLLNGRTGTAPFDDEGVLTARNPIIENGVLMGFYHNLQTASALGQRPTGNGMRGGISAPPAPCLTNLVVSSGDTPYMEMLKGIEDGVLIDRFMGTFTSNHLAGEVSGNIDLGYRIKKGEIVGRIKDSMVSINVYDVLKNQVISISQESFARGSSSFPYILLDDIFISSSS